MCPFFIVLTFMLPLSSGSKKLYHGRSLMQSLRGRLTVEYHHLFCFGGSSFCFKGTVNELEVVTCTLELTFHNSPDLFA